MKNPDKRSHKKSIRWVLIVLIMFTLWTGFTAYKQWLNIRNIKGNIETLKKEEQKVKEINNQLQKKVQLLQNKDYIADLARKYYFLSKPGEIIIISPED